MAAAVLQRCRHENCHLLFERRSDLLLHIDQQHAEKYYDSVQLRMFHGHDLMLVNPAAIFTYYGDAAQRTPPVACHVTASSNKLLPTRELSVNISTTLNTPKKGSNKKSQKPTFFYKNEYFCPYETCDKSYRQVNSLRFHTVREHKQELENMKGSTKENIQDGKKYYCHMCNAQFRTTSGLRAHQRKVHNANELGGIGLSHAGSSPVRLHTTPTAVWNSPPPDRRRALTLAGVSRSTINHRAHHKQFQVELSGDESPCLDLGSISSATLLATFGDLTDI